MKKRSGQFPQVLPLAALSSIIGSARLVGLGGALGLVIGCSLLHPPAAVVEEPAPIPVRVPDPRAPRLAPLETRHFTIADEKQELVGAMQVLFTRYENTFSAIAQHYGVGYDELRHANPGVDHWLPGEETPVYLPTEMILPDTSRHGIVINVPTMRLWYFTASKDGADAAAEASVTTYPIGIGEEGWATPLGEGTVTSKARDPVWYVPASIRKEHAARGDPLPSVVQPGPDNPLGRHALALSLPGYLIHGTNKPAGVGMRSSHGCIRLYEQDIEALFERVGKGTKVQIVNQPILAGWRDGQLYLEVHRPLAEDERDLAADARQVLARALERAGQTPVQLDQDVIAKVLREQRGIPFPVLRAQRSPEQYLAAARIIENLTPGPAADQTARVREPAAD